MRAKRRCKATVPITALLPVVLCASTITAAPGDTRICNTLGNKPAAVVFVSDDGFWNSTAFYDSCWRELDLVGTIAFVPGWVEDEDGNPLVTITDGPNIGLSHGTWAQWRELIAGGHTEVESHTFSHANVTQIDNPDQLEHEIAGSKRLIDDSIPGYHTVAFLCPQGSCNDAAIDMARESGYYSVRGGWKGQFIPLDPESGWYWGFPRQQLMSGTAVSTANAWVDEAIAEGKWFMECFHGADDEGYEPLPREWFREHWTYVAGHKDQIWNPSYGQIVRYFYEQDNAVIDVRSIDGNSMELSITDGLPDEIFNHPLTIRMEVAEGWTNVHVVQAGQLQVCEPVDESGTFCIYFDAVPDAGIIDIRNDGVTSVRDHAEAAPFTQPLVDMYDTRGHGLISTSTKRLAFDIAGRMIAPHGMRRSDGTNRIVIWREAQGAVTRVLRPVR
ncbi:MAG: polysaccharide deacetylase family protein [Chitinivibrionales bacterium]|nr:polysaccharide deacetylase family protein [Chitinivibrionales bacterium]